MTAVGGAFSLPGLRFLKALRTPEPYGPGSLATADGFEGADASLLGRLWSVLNVEEVIFAGAGFDPPPLPPPPTLGGLLGVDDSHLRDADDAKNVGYLRWATKRHGRTTDDSNLR